MRDGLSTLGHHIASPAGEAQTYGHPVVDTEVHVILRAWPRETNRNMPLVNPYTRTEHGGDVLVAELERVGVEVALVNGYDGYDFPDFMWGQGADPGDFMGGRGYALGWVQRFPERLRFVTTALHPDRPGAMETLFDDISHGASGLKFLPAYLRLRPTSPAIVRYFETLRDHGLGAIFGFEDTTPPETPDLDEYYSDLADLAADFPQVPVQVNHGANAVPGTRSMDALFELADRVDRLLVSTSVLGGPTMEWADGWRYPFPTYLEHLRIITEGVPDTKIAWGTDWPWFEGVVKYPQLLQAVLDHTDFWDDERRRLYLGGNAIRHWGLKVAGTDG